MKFKLWLVIVMLFVTSCADSNEDEDNSKDAETTAVTFDQKKWNTKDGKDYPYREEMLNDVLYNDTIRSLSKDEVIELLGEPDRISEGHLYYLISEKRLGFFTLTSKSMVIKISKNGSIEWIKTHG